MEWQMYFSAENLPEVSPVVMNWDIIRISQQGIVLCGQTIFPLLIFVVAAKRKKHCLDKQGYVQG